MTSPLAPPQDKTILDLPGLEADNLLAFLALLGLLRALELSRPDWRPRVSWIGGPPLARLHLSHEIDQDEVIRAVEETLVSARRSLAPYAFVTAQDKKGRWETKPRKSIFSSVTRAKRLKHLALRAAALAATKLKRQRKLDASSFAQLRLAFLSSLGTEDSTGTEIVDSPYKLPSGQQAFVGALFNSISRVLEPQSPNDVNAIARTLFAAWMRGHEGDSLRLSPDEERRYALRFGNPTRSSDKPKTELGANALAALGLSCLLLVLREKGWQQVGYIGRRRSEGSITWPIFGGSCGVPLRAIISVMTHIEMTKSIPSVAALECYGVSDVFRTRRFVLDPNQGDYGNVSRARSLWGKP